MKQFIFVCILCAFCHVHDITGVAIPLDSTGAVTGHNYTIRDDPAPQTLQQFLDKFKREYTEKSNKFKESRWSYMIDKTENNWKLLETEEKNFRGYAEVVKQGDNVCNKAVDDDDERKCQLIKQYGIYSLTDEKLEKYETARKALLDVYYDPKIKKYKDDAKELSLTEIKDVMASSKDYEELKYYWESFRKRFSAKEKDHFIQLAENSNEAAKINGQNKLDYVTTTYWQAVSEYSTVMTDLEQYQTELKENYELLYSYVRLKLSQKYPEKVSKYEKIPEFLTGDLLGSNWENLFDLVAFEDKTKLDLTSIMKKKWASVDEMFDAIATNVEINSQMDVINNVLKIDNQKKMDCSAVADDLSDKTTRPKDYRLKMCGEVSEKGFSDMYREIAKLDYFIAFKDEEPPFKQISSDVLLEAYSRAQSLYGISKPNLIQMKVIQPNDQINENNFLLKQALKTYPTVMYFLAVEEWRDKYYKSADLKDVDVKSFMSEVADKMGFDAQPETDFPQGAVLEVLLNDPLYPSAVGELLKYEILYGFCGNKISYDCEMPQNTLQGHKDKLIKPGASKLWETLLNDDGLKKQIENLKSYFKNLFTEINTVLKDECSKIDCTDFINGKFVEFNTEAKKQMNAMVASDWDYQTDMTDKNEENSITQSLEYSKFMKLKAKDFRAIGDKSIPSDKKRLYERITFLGYSALEDDELKKFKEAVTKMSDVYSTAKICPYKKQVCDLDKEGLELSKDLEPKMGSLRDYEELKYIWKGWRDAVGPKCKDPYKVYLQQGEKIAKANNVPTLAEVWQFEYEDKDFQKSMKEQWAKIKPLYEKLHAYVRHKLLEKYSNQFKSNEPIPAHILGNMWAQSWIELYEDVKPHEGKMNISIEGKLKEQSKGDPKYLFTKAGDFFSTHGMKKMTKTFDDKTVYEKPKDKNMVCHASAWDFFQKDDFRIKMCTQISEDHFETVHHEMGHIEYFMAYEDLDVPFRTGANPGFHEAVGDTISLSVMNPIHLKKEKLLEGDQYDLNDKENKENYLMKKALDKLPLLPFAYIVDLWRWDMFKNVSDTDGMNKKWWKLREEYQGVMPPVHRSEDDFDPAAKFHVSNDVPYIRYFFSGILQFQFHKILAGSNDLVQYVIEKTAGDKFWNMLKLGASKPWKEVLGGLANTASSDLSADGILEYFKDLETFLDDYLKKNNVKKGWDSVIDDYFKPPEPPVAEASSNVPAIVGGVLGALVCVIIGIFVYKRVKK